MAASSQLINLTIMFRSSHFMFLVTFGDKVTKNTKILRNLCLHFAREDGKNGKEITQLE